MPIKKDELKIKSNVKKKQIGKEHANEKKDVSFVFDATRNTIRNSIKWGKVAIWATRGYLIWLGVTFFVGFFGIDGDVAITILDYFFVILGLILVLIWNVKSYKILLNSKIKGLGFKGTGWVVRGAILPIVHLFMPFVVVKDLSQQYNNAIGKTYNHKLLGWWWGFWVARRILSALINNEDVIADESLYLVVCVLGVIALIVASVLFVKIVKHIIKAQRIYLKRTKSL